MDALGQEGDYMDRSKKMSETEAEIMEVLWNSEAPMSAAELIGHFAEQRGKVWKAPTLATFLSRLSQKGLVGSVRRGRVPYYHPIQTRASSFGFYRCQGTSWSRQHL